MRGSGNVRKGLRWSACLALLLIGVPAGAEEDAPAETVRRANGSNPLRIGSVPRGKPSGRWVEWRAGAKWEGEYLDGKRHGVWEGTVPITAGSLLAEPEYEGFESPLTMAVALHLNVPHGELSAVDAQQRPVFNWHFDQGVLEGKATWWHASGRTRRQVTYRAGLLDGPVTEWNTEGKVTRQDTYREGRGSGSLIEWHAPGRKRYEGQSHLPGEVTRDAFDWLELQWSQAVVDDYSSDERCGRWTAWYPNGQKKLQGSYQDGVAEGRFTCWHENGQKLAEGEYVDGKRHGEWRWWHSNGRKHMEGDFHNGQPAADWEAWTADGRTSTIDRTKTALTLDWDEKPAETLTAKRAAPSARPTRGGSADAAPARVSEVRSPKPAAETPVRATKPTPSLRSSAANVKPSEADDAPEANAGMFPGLLPGPTAVKKSPTPRPVRPQSSDDFTLIGLLLPDGSAGLTTSEMFKTTPKKNTGSPTPAARQPRGTASAHEQGAPRSLLDELLGLEILPPAAPQARAVRR